METSRGRSTVVALSALVGACHDPPPSTTPQATGSVPVFSSTPSASAIAEAGFPPTSGGPGDALVIGGDLVERSSLTVLRSLTSDSVLASALSDGVAYLTVRSGAETQLRAFATADGAKLWSHVVDRCFQPVATASGVFCEGERGAQHFSMKEGRQRTVGGEVAVVGLIRLQSRVLALSDARTVEALNAVSGELVGSLALPEQPVSGTLRVPLLAAGSLVCGAAPNDKGSTIMCFDGAPKLVHREDVSVPRGTLQQADEHLLVVSSWHQGKACEVLSTASGASLGRTATGCAAGLESGGELEGLLALEPKLRLLDPKGSLRWEGANVGHDAARALRAGPLIIIAAYSPIATGTELFAVDAKTGKPAWTADVESLPIGHSKYSNRVLLELTDEGILLIGHESSQDFAQLFDPSTGKRLASIVRATGPR